ncbi:ATP-dependent DNA helicase [Trichonephila inaurata madagascariensis]|uniref:ATP-dependent DNA helicase n=1 Tax=Trichonephila inaurata madagascariensis TaxID=2747483 RepID=A0A8X7BXJ3_9ARAC|nr:ATP-dependent DNA helicase [Trichonephila inaurata madagascariensis]
MRTEPHKQDFSNWLLDLVNGALNNDCQLREDIVEIPQKDIAKMSLFEKIFELPVFDMENLSGEAILCQKNEGSLKINEQILAKFPDQNMTCFNAEGIICEDQEEQHNFQLNFINAITISVMPPHVLNLKVEAIIIIAQELESNGRTM